MSSWSDGRNETRLQSSTIKWNLNSAVKFMHTTQTGYKTNPISRMVVKALTETIWTRLTALHLSVRIVSFQNTLQSLDAIAFCAIDCWTKWNHLKFVGWSEYCCCTCYEIDSYILPEIHESARKGFSVHIVLNLCNSAATRQGPEIVFSK